MMAIRCLLTMMGHCPRWSMEHVGSCHPRAVAWFFIWMVFYLEVFYLDTHLFAFLSKPSFSLIWTAIYLVE